MAGGPTVEDYGGQLLSDGIRFHGWRFEVSEGAIASSADVRALKSRLQAAAETDEQLPKLPEAVYLKNSLTMTHEPSGTRFSFGAEGALTHWLRNSLSQGAGGITVPAAQLGSWKDQVQEQQHCRCPGLVVEVFAMVGRAGPGLIETMVGVNKQQVFWTGGGLVRPGQQSVSTPLGNYGCISKTTILQGLRSGCLL